MAGALRLNEALTFGKNGKIKDFDAYGFDQSESSISWTKDEVAGFSLGALAVPPESLLRMTIGSTPFIHPGHVSRQQFFVFVNGLFAGFHTLTNVEKISFLLPRNTMSPRGMRFELVIPTAVSPKSLGISDDIRKLGIAVSDITFSVEK